MNQFGWFCDIYCEYLWHSVVLFQAWELWKEDAMLDLMDPTLSDSFIKDQMFWCIHVGLLCVGDSAIDRPTMSDVIAMLSNDCLTLPSPEKPYFLLLEMQLKHIYVRKN